MILTPKEMLDHLVLLSIDHDVAEKLVQDIADLILSTSLDRDLRNQWMTHVSPYEEDPPA